MLATALKIPDVGDRFLSRLLPGLSSPTTSKDISSALCQDTSKFLGSAIGLKDWRQITVGFSRAHKDPELAKIRGTDPDNQIRGHSNETANANYANTKEDPVDVEFRILKEQLQTAHWWFCLVGMLIFLNSNSNL
jgi:hypothetical protein